MAASLVIETGASGVNRLITDHLGTPRMVFDQTGERTPSHVRWSRLPYVVDAPSASGGWTISGQ